MSITLEQSWYRLIWYNLVQEEIMDVDALGQNRQQEINNYYDDWIVIYI